MTPRICVAGTPYERGRQYGTQARAQVHLSVQAYQRVFAHYAGWDWPAVRRAAAAFEAPIAAFRPAYLDEMRGIAEGAGLDLADVLAINVRTEVMYAAKARQAPLAARKVPAECSAFAVVPAPRAAGDPAAMLLGQNWDWLLHSARTLVVLEARQDDGPDFVTVVEAGLLAKAGLNAAGLGLVTNALVTDADTGTPGLPYHVLLRAILDCATVTEALGVLQAGMRSSSANYLIAHASGAALDVEAAPGDFTRLYPQFLDQGLLLHTNHFLSPRLSAVQDVSLWAMPSSAVRLQRLRAGAAGAAALDDFRALLADHADYPHSVCSHPDPDEHPLEQGATIASLLMDLTAGRLWLASGNPCQAPYRELDVSWLGTPAPVALQPLDSPLS
jgi:isopenicillin-N N-acyltransferase like protein